MNQQTFLDSFGHIADAPGGIDKLRALVLSLAVRGRLSHQDSTDEPASVLLNRIAAQRDRLVEAKEIRKPKSLPRVTADDQPALPSGWTCLRFGELFSRMGAGSTPSGGAKSYVNDGVIFLRSQNVYNSGLVLDDVARIPEATHEKMSGTAVRAGDILLNITGASIGRAAVVPRDGWTTANVNQHVSVLRPLVSETTEYLHLMMTSPYFQLLIAGSSPGASREGLAIKRMQLFPVPLPPIAEQRRIVERVDELIGLCNELEEQQADRAEARSTLTTATLHRIAVADSADDLPAAVSTFTDNIGLHLAPGEGDIAGLKRLRQVILGLAVRGKLTHQDPSEEPAIDLLERIVTERDRLIRANEIRRPKTYAPASVDGNPRLPQGWEWVRFGDLFSRMGAGSTPLGGERAYVEDGILFLRSQNIHNSGLRLDGAARIPEATHEKMAGTKVRSGDVLLNITGASIGRASVVPFEGWTTANVNQHVSVLRPLVAEVTEYLHLMMISPYFQRLIAASSPGASREGLAIKRMGIFPVPLPPVMEQQRIVERVGALMDICEELEQQFSTARALSKDLGASIVANATSSDGENSAV